MTAAPLARSLAAVRRRLPAITGLQLAEPSRVVGKYYGTTISSTFQPWRNADGKIVAHEAYARSQSKNGNDQSPWQLFADAAVDSDLVTLDRLCRTVHALNFFTRDDIDLPLIVNVDARLLQAVSERHGEFYNKVLALLGVSPQRIIIEIHTTHLIDLSRLRQVLASYRRHGFAVAVNAESVIHARSLASLLAPDFLMIYASSLAPDTLAKHLASLVGTDVRIALKHIETPQAVAAALTAKVDWVQGFHFDSPSPVIATA